MNTIKFAVFSDAHYKNGVYAVGISDLSSILEGAKAANCSLVVQCGDLCNDYIGSKAFIDTYLNSGISVYGVYGNHELECHNTISFVTPRLTNDSSVIWGTEDGKIGDRTTPYYHKDMGVFRFVFLDTNYSFNPELGEWEHNRTSSYGPPKGNLFGYSLGAKQFYWLEKLLISSAKEGKKCILVSHDSFTEEIGHGTAVGGTPDHVAIQQLFARVNAMKKGTVMMSINGHHHTNILLQKDNILYFDVNAIRNCWWQRDKEPHYKEGQGQFTEEIDQNGNVTGRKWQNFSDLSMGSNTWFSDEPLSAIVTITDEGEITIEGVTSKWAYGVRPEKALDNCVPMISSGIFKLKLMGDKEPKDAFKPHF